MKQQDNTFKSILDNILDMEVYQNSDIKVLEVICLKLIEKAYKGDLKAIEFIRNTIGQQPFKELILNNTTNNSVIILESILATLKEEAYEEQDEEILVKEALYRKHIKLYGYEKTKDIAMGKMSSLEALADCLLNDVDDNDTL